MVAAAVIGGSVIGAGASMMAADSAASAQKDAAAQSNATQLQMYNQTRADQAPWRAAGSNALNALQAWYGLPTAQSQAPSYGGGGSYFAGNAPNGRPYFNPMMQVGGKGGDGGSPMGDRMRGNQTGQVGGQSQTPDFQKILSSLPGYQFQMAQGNLAMQRNLAAHGMLDSGAAQKSLMEYGQGLASNYADKYVNGLQSLAGIGQTANQATAQSGMNAANQMSSAYGYAGNAAASGYANMANSFNQGLGGIVGGLGMMGSGSSFTPDPFMMDYTRTYAPTVNLSGLPPVT